MLVNAVHKIHPDAKIWLFGSCVDESKHGGVIDIAVLSAFIGLEERSAIRQTIEDALGEQHIDIVVSADGNASCFKLATEKEMRIDE
ncbi:hypothetical protein [Gracilinema caldarium]|uniref:DNA polymerase, beta-like region n=1 Tax=Gracilinema caldarium (strain ATCC 51460 / DSM 7334 / H1) TaxID=744872 RepID=F8F015_GRAC1|nr:hypothetical protein [Gracilinema caldarium]AEJ18668.1 DNA polymerase, beta-like region [Gracilinema caldarium DSM 7334]